MLVDLRNKNPGNAKFIIDKFRLSVIVSFQYLTIWISLFLLACFFVNPIKSGRLDGL